LLLSVINQLWAPKIDAYLHDTVVLVAWMKVVIECLPLTNT